MTDEAAPSETAGPRSRSLAERAVEQRVTATASLDDLALDVWTSDAELDAFLDDVHRSRHDDVA